MIIKKILFALLLAFGLLTISFSVAEARVSVRGYYKSNGTYVNSYYRSSPNVYRYDNYGYKSYQPTYNTSYYTRSYNYNSPLYTPDYSYTWYR